MNASEPFTLADTLPRTHALHLSPSVVYVSRIASCLCDSSKKKSRSIDLHDRFSRIDRGKLLDLRNGGGVHERNKTISISGRDIVSMQRPAKLTASKAV